MEKFENNNYTVIIVDDDDEDQMIIAKALEKSELFHIVCLQSGDELIEYLKKNYICSEEKFIVLLDIRMPKKDGFETLVEIKTNTYLKGIPIIIFSSSSNGDDVTKSYLLGANSYITKPSFYTEYEKIMSLLKNYWFETAELPENWSN